MTDEIQPVSAGAVAGVATEAAIRIDNDEGGELVLHSGCQDFSVAQYKADYPT